MAKDTPHLNIKDTIKKEIHKIEEKLHIPHSKDALESEAKLVEHIESTNLSREELNKLTPHDILFIMNKILQEEGQGLESNIGITSEYWVLKREYNRLTNP
jgi:hypothetical protein